MKKRFLFLLIILVVLVLSTIPIKAKESRSQPSIKEVSNEQDELNTYEKWRNFLLCHNGMTLEDIGDLSPGAIESLCTQAHIYFDWWNGTYTDQEKNVLIENLLNTPNILYRGPQNLPIEGIDLKSHNDQKFELEFRLYDTTVNEWILRTYAYLDYNIYDTAMEDSNRFYDGSTVKHYGPNQYPTFIELNPDISFMGNDIDGVLGDFSEWTVSSRYYTAIKNLPSRIDYDIYFHVKVLYRNEIFEKDGWHSYYYYKNFYLAWYWNPNLQAYSLSIIDDDISPPNIQSITVLNSPINENSDNVSIKINTNDFSGIAELYINFLDKSYYDNDKDNIIAIPNPRILGTHYFNVFAVDNDNDRLGDQLTATKSFSFDLIDDDNKNPVITGVIITNAPIYETSESVDVQIFAEDSSGIAESYIELMGLKYYDIDGDKHISIPNPGIIGTYGFTVNVTDADMDYEGDQLSSTLTSSFEVVDDDNENPVITGVIITNAPIYETSEFVVIEILVEDNSGIAESYIEFMGLKYYNSDIDNHIIIPNPGVIGIYDFTVNVTDADMDYEGDQLSSTLTSSFAVIDDDNEAPVIAGVTITNAPICENSESVDVEIFAEDSSGIAELYIEFMGLKYYDSDQDNHILIPNPGIIGIYGFTVNVTDADMDYEGDQLSCTLTSSFEVFDEDIYGPVITEINIINAPIYDAYDNVIIEIFLEDASGISDLYIEYMNNIYRDYDGDCRFIIPNPINPGLYEFKIVAIDADIDHEGDQSNTTIFFTFEVYDDDVIGPDISEITLLNGPIYDSHDYIEIKIIAADISGIGDLYINFMGNIYKDDDKDNVIEIPNPILPGIYDFSINAFDADSEYDGDESYSIESFGFEVLDDDVIAPIISEINLLNSPIYDSSDEIIIQISAQDFSGIAELYIEFMGIIYEDENGDYRILIPNPTIPGNYTFKLIAIDADMEFEGDQSLSEVLYEFQVLDDDTTAPQIFIHKTWFGWNVSIIDNDGNIDSNATGNYLIIDQNGRIWYFGYISQENINYSLFIHLKPGIYTLIVNATNNDIEWNGDEEISEISSQINRTLADCYLYVNNQLEILKNYVDANLYCILAWSIRCKLWLAQENLNNAYELIENGSVTCGLLHDAMAQILIEITEFETEFYLSLSLISYEEAEYVITSLHSIRNNIVYLMGSSVDYSLGTLYGYDIASIEVNMLNLKDFIEIEINETDRANLENMIVYAAMKLEMAIFQLSLEDDINETLITALNNLNNALTEVISLKDSGKISQDLANILLLEINTSKNELEFIINSI